MTKQPSENQPLIRLQGITKVYGTGQASMQALRGIDLDVYPEDFVAVMGPSGSGKSTCMNILGCLDTPTGGAYRFQGVEVSGLSRNQRASLRRYYLGFVFQGFNLLNRTSALENVELPLIYRGIRAKKRRAMAMQALETVGLTQWKSHTPGELSGGQQQRVALARALVAEPKLLLLDEPLSNLDAKLRESMRFEIKEIQRKLGVTVIYVTHDQTEAMAMSDRIFLIHQGVVQQVDEPERIYREPVNQFVADFLGKVDFFKGQVEGNAIRLVDMDISLPYEGPRTGAVEVAVRPENISISKEGPGIKGLVTAAYYLGDVSDYRVRVGNSSLRVIADGRGYRQFKPGDEATLTLLEFLVYDDDGSLDEQLKIQT